MSNVYDLKILVVGAGGLGCELLKNLVLNRFDKISIVDFDKIAISNLNRQFLFSEEDVGKFKAEVAFNSIRDWINLKFSQFFIAKIEDLGLKFLRDFDVIFSALDSVESRRWKFLIDGGSQNLYGHVRLIVPGKTPCIECFLSLYSSEEPLPCVLSENLKTPEDCIYHTLYFDIESSNKLVEEMGSLKFIQHVYEIASNLGKERGISGVTLDLVDQICNKSVPDVTTTNAIISSLMINTLTHLNDSYNFIFYSGDGETSLEKFNLQSTNCIVCKCNWINLDVNGGLTLKELINKLSLILKFEVHSISSKKGMIYLDKPECVKSLYQSRLNMEIGLV